MGETIPIPSHKGGAAQVHHEHSMKEKLCVGLTVS